jgi:2-oxoglutarate dehydrogenase E1 component
VDATQTENTLSGWWGSSPLAGANAPYIEELYELFLQDPRSVDERWRRFFETLPPVNGAGQDIPHAAVRDYFRTLARQPAARAGGAPAAAAVDEELVHKQVRVLQLINAYRFRGHQLANLDPLGLTPVPEIPELHLRYYGLSDLDLDTEFDTGSLVGPRRAKLRDILELLKQVYCGSIGAEYMHITDTQEKRWLQSALEGVRGVPAYPAEVRRGILERLTAAEGLERFLATKYVGAKRFGLEGGEALIPMLDELIQRAGGAGTKEIIMGMAHRGRLNVLVNILGKSPEELFAEFEGKKGQTNGTGDVKYHMGFSSDVETPGGGVHLALAFNPSHLEIVSPVVEGSVRARQMRRGDRSGVEVVPVIMHGDAAFAGQGVVMETFNMSQSRGFTTMGTVHIVINNQVGFTTSVQRDARSTLYCTDVAKMVNAPIFHVSGDDPEAVLFVTQIALDYRMMFRKDVVIDLFCYRRQGHNESDDPTMTQPVMYKRIKEHATTRALYAKRLEQDGVLDAEAAQQLVKQYEKTLEAGKCVAPRMLPPEKLNYEYATDWTPYVKGDCDPAVETRVDLETLRDLGTKMLTLPEGFELNPQVAKVMDNRRKMVAGALPLDWGCAELLAYATLLKEGTPVRMSGQDCGRGTFSHRHAVLHNFKDGTTYVPLRGLYERQPDFRVINSLLSEEAVLAFEYGYSTTDPRTMVIWEAQFGDFVNGAQVVIDQFIAAGEQKWGRLSGLTMFLPHGFEGQGPEHSSARLERFLQLSAQHNMFVCAPTTPAQFFHMIRRQMRFTGRKPLVVMTPKSLLRHRLSVSSLEDLSKGIFRLVIRDSETEDTKKVKRIVMCSGKVYFDLAEKRKELKRDDIAIIRVEQLYPFPEKDLKQELERYPNARRFIWCQEEPMNQGAWFPSQHHMWSLLPKGCKLEYAGRPMSAAPAVGDHKLHVQQLHEFLEQALGGKD